MKTWQAVALGVGVGFVVAKLLSSPDNCCDRVAAAVREKVGDKLGTTAQTVGDVLGVWSFTPGLLNLFGVPL